MDLQPSDVQRLLRSLTFKLPLDAPYHHRCRMRGTCRMFALDTYDVMDPSGKSFWHTYDPRHAPGIDKSAVMRFALDHRPRIADAVVKYVGDPCHESLEMASAAHAVGRTYQLTTSGGEWIWVCTGDVAEIVGANHHVLVCGDQTVIDPTVEQFGPHGMYMLVVK